jgi:hypothetical protein
VNARIATDQTQGNDDATFIHCRRGQPAAWADNSARSYHGQANLGAALNGGKKWKADAILIQVAGSRIGADGKHIAWEYGFCSAAAKTCAVV